MTKKQIAAMSPAETEILRLVWELGGATVQEVVDKLPPDRQIAYATVQTLLRRLEQKSYLRHESRGKAHVFMASVQKEEVISRTVKDFLNRLFGGDPIPLVQYLAEHGEITSKDIDGLKKLIEKPKGNSKAKGTGGSVV